MTLEAWAMDHRTAPLEPTIFAVPQAAAQARIAALQDDARRGRVETAGHGWRHALGTGLLRLGAALIADEAARGDEVRRQPGGLRATGRPG